VRGMGAGTQHGFHHPYVDAISATTTIQIYYQSSEAHMTLAGHE
jgi:hypothetical protein